MVFHEIVVQQAFKSNICLDIRQPRFSSQIDMIKSIVTDYFIKQKLPFRFALCYRSVPEKDVTKI